jgi:hypothetical protein
MYIGGFHAVDYEDYHHVGYNAVQFAERQPRLRRNLLPILRVE